MVLLYGKCVGLVKNHLSESSDANCQVHTQNWNYQLYKFENYKPEIDMLTEFLTVKGMGVKGLVMTGTDKATTIGKDPFLPATLVLDFSASSISSYRRRISLKFRSIAMQYRVVKQRHGLGLLYSPFHPCFGGKKEMRQF